MIAIAMMVAAFAGALTGTVLCQVAPVHAWRRWCSRVADNIARRVSPCPECEGWGNDLNEPGGLCPRNCAAARRLIAVNSWLHRTPQAE